MPDGGLGRDHLVPVGVCAVANLYEHGKDGIAYRNGILLPLRDERRFRVGALRRRAHLVSLALLQSPGNQ